MAEGTPIIIKKKKGHGGHGHHGGSWKVAYADFVTAMMAFFMVMWIMGLSDSSKAQVSGYFNDPSGFMKSMPRSNNILNIRTGPPRMSDNTNRGTGTHGPKDGEAGANEAEELQKVAGEVNKAVGQQALSDVQVKFMLEHLEATLTDEGLRIEMMESAGNVFFETGSAAIRPQARKLIETIGRIIVRSGRKVVLEGHTDARPYSGKGYDNWNLSTDRALSLCRALRGSGVTEKQFMMVRGMAATNLRNPKNPLDPTNRRVSILLPYGERLNPGQYTPKEQAKQEITGPQVQTHIGPKSINLRQMGVR